MHFLGSSWGGYSYGASFFVGNLGITWYAGYGCSDWSVFYNYPLAISFSVSYGYWSLMVYSSNSNVGPIFIGGNAEHHWSCGNSVGPGDDDLYPAYGYGGHASICNL
jgi:hypothetical protein